MSGNDKWSVSDEFMRMAESYLQKTKPTSISDVLDILDQLAKAKAPRTNTGFDGLVDDPRAATPSPEKETPVTKSNVTGKIYLFTCPACQDEVQGTGHYKLVQDAVPTLDDSGRFVAEMELIGVEADTHICLPGAWE